MVFFSICIRFCNTWINAGFRIADFGDDDDNATEYDDDAEDDGDANAQNDDDDVSQVH